MVKPKSKKSDLPAEEKEASQQKAAENFKNAMRRICDALIKRVDVMKASDWKQGWTDGRVSGVPQNLRGRNYGGGNSFMLFLDTVDKGYKTPVYITFNDSRNLGTHINKGEKSVPVLEHYYAYWNPDTKETIYPSKYADLSDEEKKAFRRFSGYRVQPVFNIDQTNLREVRPDYYAKILKRFNTVEVSDSTGMYENAAIDRMLSRSEWVCPIRMDSKRGCYYSPTNDYVAVPPKENFAVSEGKEEKYKDGMEYYSSVLHEMAHSTGHESRLNRPKFKKWGDAVYAREELIAEISAASIGSMLGFDSRIQDNNAAYIKGWLQSLKEKPEDIENVLKSVNRASYMLMENIDKQRLALGEEPLLNANKKSEISEASKELQQVSDAINEQRKSGYSMPDEQDADAVAEELIIPPGYLKAAEKEYTLNRQTALSFDSETEEQYMAFEKRIPSMSDEELLKYIAADSPDVTKQAHPALGDEYDYRHSGEWEEYVKAYGPVLDGEFSRGGIEGVRAFEQKAWQEWKSGGYASKEDRTRLRAELDSCDEFLSSKKVREDVIKEKDTMEKYAKRDDGVSAIKEDSNADTNVASLAKILMEENGLSADDASRRAKNILNSKINDNMEEKKKEDAAVKEQQSQKEAEQKSQQVSEQKQQEAKKLEKSKESEKQARQKAEQKAKEEKTPEAKAEKRIPRLVQAALLTAALAEGAKRDDGVFMNAAYNHEPQIYGKDFKLKPYNSAMLTLDTDRHGYKSAVYMSSYEARKNEMPVRRGQQSVPLNVVKYDTYVNRFDKEKTITAEEFRKLPKDDKMLYRVKPENSYSPYFNIDQTIMHHVKRDDYDKAVAGNVTKEGYREIALLNASKAAKEYVNTVAGRMGIGITRDASAHETVYDPKTKSIKIGELGEKTGIEEARARLRALVTAVGEPQYLGRKEKMGLPAADAKKYDKLVTEVSTGVLLSKLGVPAALDEKSRSLVPYWERESKENPNFMRAVEYNVNHSVNALQRLSEGKRVDYSVLRGERKDVVSEKASYVASQVSKGADMGTKTFVIIRDDKNKAASVVLPKGASVDVDNEVPGMRKDRIAKALVKEGYEDVKFYNRNGALGLRMTNDEFKDKKVSTANVKQYSIVNERPMNLDKFLRRADTQNIIAVKPFKNQAGKWEINVFPDRGKPFSVRPDQPDMTRFFKAKNGDPVRLEIGQKYAIITRIHPELKTKGPIPDVDKRIDLGRIGKVKIEPDKYNKSKSILWTRIDGKPMHVSVEKSDVQSMYATSAHGKGEHTAEDLGRMEEFKTHLAANLFSGYLLGESVAKEQSVAAGESLDAAKVPDSLSVDAAPKVKIEPERESHASRGMH